MFSSRRYLQGEPAQALQRGAQSSSGLNLGPRGKLGKGTAALSAAGKRPGWGQASKQPTEHPTFRVLSIFVTSHTTTIMIIFLSKLVFKNIVFIIQISD